MQQRTLLVETQPAHQQRTIVSKAQTDCCESFSQVEHQAPIVALTLLPGASRAAARSADGALGIMDIRNETYATLLRAHTSAVIDLAVHPTR